METITSSYSQVLLNRKFLPVHIDNNFLSLKFVDEASDRIDAKIIEVTNMIRDRLDKGRGIDDLKDYLSRLTKLKMNLSEIVGKLRDLKCTDLSDTNFDSGIKRLIAEIKKSASKAGT